MIAHRTLPVAAGLLAGVFALAAVRAVSAADAQSAPAYTNRLIDSDSPYLLAHAHNPVDWYPWGAEAFERARREHKPIFLSIGYSTCYWCHVAERTLFSQAEIAKLMNEWFVSIKVDREQRPDIDAAYMLATQLLTGGSGGWPNNLFLTPDLEPFYAGGYFPPADDESGRPGFPSVLAGMHEEWSEHQDRIRERAHGVAEVLRRYQAKAASTPAGAGSPREWSEQTRKVLLARFDSENGGFSDARQSTKFPQSPALLFLLADYERTHDAATLRAVTVTLDAMAYGGIYDQLGGGFHRYSTERTWSIPHFEKMLYDNAQLLSVYTRAWKLTHRPQYRRVALGIRDYLRMCLMAPEGGFYTAEDAEVDGEEGATYLWSSEQIAGALGDKAAQFLDIYALTPMPDDAQSIEPETARGALRVAVNGGVDAVSVEKNIAALDAQRTELLRTRDKRAQPARDEKLLIGLNGLAIDALVTSAAALHGKQDVRDAERAARRLWHLAWDQRTKHLQHQVFRERAGGDGYLEDYALFGRGLLSLYRATGNSLWRSRAALVADAMLVRFGADREAMPASAASAEHLFITAPDLGDDTYPSGSSGAVALLVSLSEATGRRRYAQAAQRMARRAPGPIEQRPLMVAALQTVELDISRSEPAPAAAARASAEHVRASGHFETTSGGTRIVVTLDVERGFHVNANPASFDFLVPTSLDIEGIRPIDVRYPPGMPFKSQFAPDTLSVYEGSVRVVAQLDTSALAGKRTVRVMVNTQTCTQTVCLPPVRIPLEIKVVSSSSKR